MSRLRQRNAVLQAVAMKMLEEGRPLSKREYENCSSTPVRSADVLRHFSSWTRMLSLIESDLPEVWKELNGKKEVNKDPLAELAAKRSKAAISSDEMVHES